MDYKDSIKKFQMLMEERLDEESSKDISMKEAIDRATKAITKAKDFKSAIDNLKSIGVEINEKLAFRNLGHLQSPIYSYITGQPDPIDTGDLGVSDDENKKIEKMVDGATEEIEGLKNISSLDSEGSPFHFFNVGDPVNERGGGERIYLKALDYSDILRIAKFVEANESWFYQFKIVYGGRAFVLRRDNTVLNLSPEGVSEIRNILNKIKKEIKLEPTTGKSLKYSRKRSRKDRTDDISGNQVRGFILAYILSKMAGAPEKLDVDSLSSRKYKDVITVANELGGFDKFGIHVTDTDKPKPQNKETSRGKDVAVGNKPLVLRTEDGKSQSANITASIGQASIKKLYPDLVRFFSQVQFKLVKTPKAWILVPNKDAGNGTLINGQRVEGDTVLNYGDVISVGRPEKHVGSLTVDTK